MWGWGDYKVIHNGHVRMGTWKEKGDKKMTKLNRDFNICVKALRVWTVEMLFPCIQSSFFPFQKGSPWHVILFLAHKPKSIYFDQFSSLGEVFVIHKAPIISKHGETAMPLPLTLRSLTKDIL